MSYNTQAAEVTAAQSTNGQTSTYTEPIYQRALEHVWIHSGNYLELAEQQGLHVFERGEGSTLYDAREGLDGRFIGVVGGQRRPRSPGNRRSHGPTSEQIGLCLRCQLHVDPRSAVGGNTRPVNPWRFTNQVFFCSGGSEAVETAIKIAKQVQVLRGFPKRSKIIARRGSYHGMTYGAMSLTTGNRTQMERFFGPLMPGVYHVPSPNHYRNDFGLSGEEGDIMCAKWVEQEIVFQGPETVAAVIGEPISSANGVHIPSPKYWQMLREICDKHGVLLIMDEVICGFGRTGKWFATEHFGVVPDIMTIAKGLSSGYAPIAAAIVRPSVYEVFMQGPNALSHLLTFGGQAVAAAAALKNIEIMEREGLVARSAEMGTYLLSGLQTLVDTHPTVGDARGLGLLCAIELVKDKGTKEKWARNSDFIKRLHQLVTDNRILTRVWEILHIAPPLVVTRAEIDQIVGVLDRCLTQVEQEFGLR